MEEADLLLDRASQMRETYLRTFGLYVTWYTFFWTLNLVALAWVHGWSGGWFRIVTGLGFAVAAVLGAMTSFRLLEAAQKLATDMTAIWERLANTVIGESDERAVERVRLICSTNGLPEEFAVFGLRVNGAMTSLLSILWVLVGLSS